MRSLLLFLASFLFAQLATSGRADPAAATPSPAVEAKVRAAENEERNAVLASDVSALERLWSADIIVNNPQSSITPTRDALLQRVREGKSITPASSGTSKRCAPAAMNWSLSWARKKWSPPGRCPVPGKW